MFTGAMSVGDEPCLICQQHRAEGVGLELATLITVVMVGLDRTPKETRRHGSI